MPLGAVSGVCAAVGLVYDTPRLLVMRKRSDFVAANSGLRVARGGVVLLVKPNAAADLRFGITVTKRIGNAVVRNRMKRRLRALVRDVLPRHGLAGHDHVLIGRESGVERDFATMRAELLAALERARAGKGDPPRGPRSGPRGKRPAKPKP
jgi:ribonuclease P protein component